LSITIITIFKKYKNHDENFFRSLELEPKIEISYSVKNFHIEKNEIYLHIENNINNIQLIRVYNLKTGKLSAEIELK